MNDYYKEKYQLVLELREYLQEKNLADERQTTTPQKFAVDFTSYLHQFLAGHLNLILASGQSNFFIEEFFRFSRHLELNKLINRYSIIELFVQLFDACELEKGLQLAFKVLDDQIYRHGLILQDHQDNYLYDSDSNPNCELLMIRLCKSIVKQLRNSGLCFEGEMKTSIKSLLARTIPLCHKSGLNLSGRFSGATGSSQGRDIKRTIGWIEEEEEQQQDQNNQKDAERKHIEKTREYKIF